MDEKRLFSLVNGLDSEFINVDEIIVSENEIGADEISKKRVKDLTIKKITMPSAKNRSKRSLKRLAIFVAAVLSLFVLSGFTYYVVTGYVFIPGFFSKADSGDIYYLPEPISIKLDNESITINFAYLREELLVLDISGDNNFTQHSQGEYWKNKDLYVDLQNTDGISYVMKDVGGLYETNTPNAWKTRLSFEVKDNKKDFVVKAFGHPISISLIKSDSKTIEELGFSDTNQGITLIAIPKSENGKLIISLLILSEENNYDFISIHSQDNMSNNWLYLTDKKENRYDSSSFKITATGIDFYYDLPYRQIENYTIHANYVGVSVSLPEPVYKTISIPKNQNTFIKEKVNINGHTITIDQVNAQNNQVTVKIQYDTDVNNVLFNLEDVYEITNITEASEDEMKILFETEEDTITFRFTDIAFLIRDSWEIDLNKK